MGGGNLSILKAHVWKLSSKRKTISNDTKKEHKLGTLQLVYVSLDTKPGVKPLSHLDTFLKPI